MTVDIDESIEAALQLRDRLRDGSLDRSLCCNVYPDGSPEALPHALDQLLGECSACNLHTAIALVSKMKALGIKASCSQLVMRPEVALQRRQRNQGQQQIAFGRWGRRKAACYPKVAFYRAPEERQQSGGWASLTPDLLLAMAQLVEDRDLHIMALACGAWRDVLDPGTRRMSFAWATGHAFPEINRVVRGAAVLFQHLEAVSLRRGARLDDGALMCLAGACGPRLKELDLSGCQCLTNAGLISLAQSCPSLRALNVSSCYELTDVAFQALGSACSGLLSLNVCGCDRLTDVGLSALAKGARSLRVLTLGWCEAITEAGLQALAEHCHELEVLDLCGCIKVRDSGVVALAVSCPGLTSLGLHCCRKLTDASAAAIAANLRHLRSLNVSGCMPMSCQAVQAVVDANPGLHTCRSFSRTVIIGGCLSLLEVSCSCKRQSLW